MSSLSTLLISLVTFITPAAFAAANSAQIKSILEAQKECGSFVRVDQANAYLGFARYKNATEEPRLPVPALVNVAPLSGSQPFTLSTKDGAIDMITDGSTAYILTYTSIEEWNLDSHARTNEYATTNEPAPLEYKRHASAFARFGNQLVIAHGRLGLTVFDLGSKKIVGEIHPLKEQLPLESMATGITVQGSLAYVTYDSYTLPAQGDENKDFRGLVVIDLAAGKIVSQMGGMDPGATSVTSDANRVVVNFDGLPLWKYDLNALRSSKGAADLPSPLRRVFRFPDHGHPTGSAAMDDVYYYTCFSTPPPSGSGLMIRTPRALERSSLGLD